MLYRLSKFVPVRMRSTYKAFIGDGPSNIVGVGHWRVERATWWQFRNHIFRHRRVHI